MPTSQQLFLDSIKRQEIQKKLEYIKGIKEDLLAEKLMDRARFVHIILYYISHV